MCKHFIALVTKPQWFKTIVDEDIFEPQNYNDAIGIVFVKRPSVYISVSAIVM